MDITVTKAGPEDLDLLMEWRMRVLAEVFADYTDVDWEAIRRQNRTYYRIHLADGSHTACFARDRAGQVVGCGGICYQTEMPSPDNENGSCAYLMNIFALPQARHQGVGRQIVAFLIQDAKDRGTCKIYLESSQAAKRMYGDMGFQPMVDYYKLDQ
jgi:GNAT superfamily N-acetyltransferase